jgi:hypothetical protein
MTRENSCCAMVKTAHWRVLNINQPSHPSSLSRKSPLKIKNLLAGLLLALLFCQPTYAKGLLIYNTGDELFEVADFPAELVSEFRDLNSMRAGYKCDRFGLFWADVWTWNCAMVGVSAESYSDLPAKVVSTLSADPHYAFKHAKRGFWNHYGILAVLAALGGYALLRRIL